jgi:CheY-like chemotaxis protein
LKKPRILVVDDDVTMLEMLRMALSGRPFDAAFFDSGVKAMAFYMGELGEGRTFGAHLFDCAMPHFDGFTMTQIVRLTEKTGICPRSTIGVFTAYPRTVERSTLFEESGADYYLRKPEDVTAVPDLITEWLTREVDGQR